MAVAGRTTEPGPASKGGAMAAVAGRDLGVHSYYQGKIDEMELVVRDRTQNLERLKAQRNELNAKVRMLREELHHLQESGSYVGEVVKAMGKKKVRAVTSLASYCVPSTPRPRCVLLVCAWDAVASLLYRRTGL